jgi:hypothetical protein
MVEGGGFSKLFSAIVCCLSIHINETLKFAPISLIRLNKKPRIEEYLPKFCPKFLSKIQEFYKKIRPV